MTNKKLKLAAMSVALTACVAAQPMAAHAVEGPDSIEDNAAPQAEPVVENSTPAPVAEEGEKQEEAGEQEEFVPPVNEEAKSEEQAPAFGPGTKTDDIIIDYKPAEKPEEPGKSGEDGEADGSEGSGETDETENPDGTYVKGDVIDNSKKDEATGKDGKIGEATKEETPDSSSSTTVVDPDAEVKKGDPVVGKDEDGNTTITTPTETTGTQTTTTTGIGKADSTTTITDTKKGEEINLDDELGKDVRPDWKTDKDATLGGYTVDKVEPAEDGNSKTLTLKKTSEPETKEIEMSAEDVAKLLDVPEDGVEKKTDDEGNTTYILKKEETSTDENGNTVTRVTYYKITGNTVETTTETTLKLKVEKGTVDVNNEDLTTEIELPSITAKNTDETKTDVIEISSEKLGEMLQDEYYNNDTGEYVYTETDANGKEYTYKVKKTEDTKPLTNEQLAKRLGNDFTYDSDDDSISYKGEKLTFDQKEAVRKTLSYTVEVTEVTKTPGQIEGGNAKKEQAENDAKLAAIRDALTKAAEEAGIDTTGTDFEAKLKDISSTGADSITFTYTDNDGNQHTVTFQYDGATVSTAYDKTGETTVGGKDAEDVTNNTVTGTAYVTGGKESWSETKEITGSGSILGNDFTKLPDGVTEDQVLRDDKNRITKIQTDNDVYEFTYNDNVTLSPAEIVALQKKGCTLKLDSQNLTAVSWKKTTTTTHTTTKTDEKKSNIKISDSELVTKDGDTYTIKVNGKDITGFQRVSDTEDTTTYTKTADGKTTTVTVTKTALKPFEITEKLRRQYSVNAKTEIMLGADEGGMFATWTNNANNSVVKVYYTDRYTETLTVTEQADHNLNATKKEQLVFQVENKMAGLDNGDKLILNGKNADGSAHQITITCTGKDSFTISDGEKSYTLSGAVGDTAVKTELGTIIEKIAQNMSIHYDKLTPEDIWNLLDIQQVYGDSAEGSEFASGTDSYWPEAGYENICTKKDGTTYGESFRPTTNFNSVNLDAEVSIAGKDAAGNAITYDGVLLRDGLSFKYGHKEEIAEFVDQSKYPDEPYSNLNNTNPWTQKDAYDKEKLHTTNTVTNANLANDITMTDGSVWNKDKYGNNVGDYDTGKKLVYACEGNTLTGKGFYNVSGKVAYDEASRYTDETAAKAARDLLLKDNPNATVVAIPTAEGLRYVVYKNVTKVNAIGYMTASANTNAQSNSAQNRNNWTPGSGIYSGSANPGGYDLRIQGLQLVDGKVQGNYGVKYGLDMSIIKSSEGGSNSTLQTGAYSTTTSKTCTTTERGCDRYGNYTVSYTKDLKKCGSKFIEGTGTGSSYKTFTEVLKKIFSGSGSKEHDEGKVSYTYRTTDKVDTTPVSKETVTTTDAHVDYNYTSIETRTVTVDGEETVIVPPVTPPETPVEDETPDEVVTPETPELPAVQDAAPDDAAPETPVLPSDAVLPAVQDATALPQTGVNWMAALGMAFSGMLLTIAGAFTSLKYKEKH